MLKKYKVMGAVLLITVVLMIAAVAPASASSNGGWTYVVRHGDTLANIAWRYHTTVSALMYANPCIYNPNVIYAGQRLVIPAPYYAPKAYYPPPPKAYYPPPPKAYYPPPPPQGYPPPPPQGYYGQSYPPQGCPATGCYYAPGYQGYGYPAPGYQGYGYPAPGYQGYGHY